MYFPLNNVAHSLYGKSLTINPLNPNVHFSSLIRICLYVFYTIILQFPSKNKLKEATSKKKSLKKIEKFSACSAIKSQSLYLRIGFYMCSFLFKILSHFAFDLTIMIFFKEYFPFHVMAIHFFLFFLYNIEDSDSHRRLFETQNLDNWSFFIFN